MNRRSISFLILAVVLLALMVIFSSKNYLLFSFGFLVLTLGIYFWRFEKAQHNSREVVFIAIVCALAVVGRIIFAALPAVKPELFILIMGAIVSGPETGFLMGTIIALTSNMYFGQGVWTPWQMFALGVIGLISGLMLNKKTPTWILTVWGFVSAFVMGWIMDIYYILGFVDPITIKSVLTALAASFYFDVVHAIFTAVLLLLVGKRWIKIFSNYKQKYDLFKQPKISSK
ncbi:metal ion ABC transporter, membrane-spanning subunit [Companilactobacillus mindensis DSM 14500]|uniref:Metal ion ABC transporter, membrane-spanning subunit n=2 Tax=Companilactobacillus mindensis TaxID=167481 RepID=A0A0R1QIQ8_9LACO|nr:ECF transporter S component [Companilactobacillus mindensis]KRL44726.1 metal ion ABC transporter, membrane-spanning subunit [Companilactobacillus mindensis DSM 14500]